MLLSGRLRMGIEQRIKIYLQADFLILGFLLTLKLWHSIASEK